MDIKIEGITEEIMEVALNQARAGRLHILVAMNEVLANARADVSIHAPTYATIQINPEKIRDVIGKGGATIRAICEETKATIDMVLFVFMAKPKVLLKPHSLKYKPLLRK